MRDRWSESETTSKGVRTYLRFVSNEKLRLDILVLSSSYHDVRDNGSALGLVLVVTDKKLDVELDESCRRPTLHQCSDE